MLVNKKIVLITLLLHTFSLLASLKSNLNNYKEEMFENNEYKVGLSYLKIENDKIYNSYLLAKDNEILISDNIDEIRPLASLTKIMTAMVVLDNVKNLNEKVTISSKEANIPYGARLKTSEVYTVYELLKLMLIKSTNSAAMALADHVSDNFVELMNEKARKLNISDINYCTVHGLPPSYTNTCLDMGSAKAVYEISKYAIENYEIIAEIARIKNDKIKRHNIVNTNDLLEKVYGIKGLKTGYHKLAGYNISIYYEDEDTRLYEIILGSDSAKNRSKITREVIRSYENFGGNK